MTRVWAKKGTRPTAVRQTKYEWAYLYAAVESAAGASTTLLAPEVNVEAFELFLSRLAGDLEEGDHALLIMDQAGWHTSRKLVVPEGVSILFLPPYAPELNPVERLWHYLREHYLREHYLREHYLSNRVYDGYDHLLDAGYENWHQLTPEVLQSVCRCDCLSYKVISRAN